MNAVYIFGILFTVIFIKQIATKFNNNIIEKIAIIIIRITWLILSVGSLIYITKQVFFPHIQSNIWNIIMELLPWGWVVLIVGLKHLLVSKVSKDFQEGFKKGLGK